VSAFHESKNNGVRETRTKAFIERRLSLGYQPTPIAAKDSCRARERCERVICSERLIKLTAGIFVIEARA
jgi:hypothetical protein